MSLFSSYSIEHRTLLRYDMLKVYSAMNGNVTFYAGQHFGAANRMAWQYVETLVEIRETLANIWGTTK